jgi:hypothetical protein
LQFFLYHGWTKLFRKLTSEVCGEYLTRQN